MQAGLTGFQIAVQNELLDIAKLYFEVGGKDLLGMRNAVSRMLAFYALLLPHTNVCFFISAMNKTVLVCAGRLDVSSHCVQHLESRASKIHTGGWGQRTPHADCQRK